MRRIAILAAILTLLGSLSCQAANDKLDGFLDVPFGTTWAEVETIMADRPNTTREHQLDVPPDQMVYRTSFLGEIQTVTFEFYEGRFWRGTAWMWPEDLSDAYQEFANRLSFLFGSPESYKADLASWRFPAQGPLLGVVMVGTDPTDGWLRVCYIDWEASDGWVTEHH